MPRAGRPPLKRTAKRKKPSVLKYIDGSKDPLPEDEPTPDLLAADIPPPDHFTEEETEFFRDTVKNLLHMNHESYGKLYGTSHKWYLFMNSSSIDISPNTARASRHS